MTSGPVGPAAELAELVIDYEILGELGRGGSAVVYRARDRSLGRDVAIKVVHPRPLSAEDDAVARLAREARTVAQLQHPSIVTVFAVRRLPGGGLALVMQLVPGSTLKAVVQREGPFTPDRCKRVLHDVASALAYAHSRGVIHRDVKPENIFLDEESGRALLSDFGIARSEESDSMTLTGTAIGTPFYMSPEQIDGAAVDGRSDLYSLGLVAWEMLTGSRPWDGESLYNVIYKQKHEQLPPIEALRPGVPPRLQYLVERMLQKSPGARWAGAEGLLSQLEHSVLPGDYGKWQEALRKRVERYHAAERERARSAAAPPPSAGGLLASTMRFVRGATGSDQRADGSNADPPRDVALGDTTTVPRTASISVAPRARASASAAPTVVEPASWETSRSSGRWPWVAGAVVTVALVAVATTQAVRAGRWTHLVERVRAAATGSPTRPPAAATDTPDPTTSSTPAAAPAEPPETLAPLPVVGENGPSLIALGGRHSCVVTSSGAISCWGANDRGQLGDGTAVRQRLPAALAARLSFASVAAGLVHSCGVTTQGDVYCWGDDSTGQLGDATTVRRNAPVRVAGPGVYRTVSAGDAHTCATTIEGSVDCWGSNRRGQLGDGTLDSRATPSRIAGLESVRFIQVVTGSAHSCALSSEGEAFCWGANDRSQLGVVSGPDRKSPAALAGLRFIALAAGQMHTCGLLADGSVRCWGANGRGQLGTGTRTTLSTPTAVRLATPVLALAAGGQHTCALSTRGEAFCWGGNAAGQLGDSSGTDAVTPARVRTPVVLARVAAGVFHTCGATYSGELFCWGDDAEGQLGDGAGSSRATPSLVALGSGSTLSRFSRRPTAGAAIGIPTRP